MSTVYNKQRCSTCSSVNETLSLNHRQLTDWNTLDYTCGKWN